MRKLLIVIDMQNDFIDGSLGTREAERIVPKVIEKIRSFSRGDVFATQDTHGKDYLETEEGRNLPVSHCILGTHGWKLREDVAEALEEREAKIVEKPTFGSLKLAEEIRRIYEEEKGEVSAELIGLCTDICVISNALLLKAYLPEMKITVDASCCAGVTPELHEAALKTMASCQIKDERASE